jgi:Spy/CpxP family protein refolding chaperone
MIVPPGHVVGLRQSTGAGTTISHGEKTDMKLLCAAVMAAVVLASPAALAQDKPADNMAIVMEKVRADKKLLVAGNMNLTESEAAAFWPVYEAYQKDLSALNVRTKKAIESYAAAYGQGTVPDETAKKLLDETLAIEASELELKRSYVPKFQKVLPAAKVARYYQIENKIRAAVRYELAAAIPLVK